MCSQEFGKSKFEITDGAIVEVDEESGRAATFERIRAYLEHGSPGPWSMTDGNLVIGADETPIARLVEPWTAFNCALVANSPTYIGFLLSEIDRLNGVHRASWDLQLGNQESLRSALAEMQEKLDAGAEALGDWINRGVVPGAIGACIENLRESHDRFELKVAQLQQGLDRSIDERQKLLIANEELLAAKRERDGYAETIVQLTADLGRVTAELEELRTTNAALGLMAVESLGKAAEADRELAAKSHSLARLADVEAERNELRCRLNACAEALGDWLRGDGAIPWSIEEVVKQFSRAEDALADAEAARDRAIEERTTIGVRAADLTAKNHALREDRDRMKSVVWTLNNALTTYHDFTSELLEAQRLASQVPGLYADDWPPAQASPLEDVLRARALNRRQEPEVVVDVKFDGKEATDRMLEELAKHPGVTVTSVPPPSSDQVPSL